MIVGRVTYNDDSKGQFAFINIDKLNEMIHNEYRLIKEIQISQVVE